MTNVTVRVRIIALELLLAAAILTIWLAPPVAAVTSSGDHSSTDAPVTLEIYVDKDCVNCAKQQEWLSAELLVQYPDLLVVTHELHDNADNKAALVQLGKERGFPTIFTPTTVLADRVWIGFTDQIAADITANLARSYAGESVPAGVYGQVGDGTCSEDALQCDAPDNSRIISVPFLGEVNLGGHSLAFSSVLIGFVDGINPCSLWVISVLLAIVLRTGSRRRVLAIGAVFLIVTSIMYALYMVAIYSAMSLVVNLRLIQWIVGGIALVFGLFALKDYFGAKRGPSLSISDSAKPGLYQRMRKLAGHKSLLPALGATVALAVLVSLLETPCTAGFPLLWTGMLHAADVNFATAAGLFLIYMVPFLLDELLVFGIAVWTMRATKMQEKHGEILKLVAGSTMVTLALVMLTQPRLMEDPIIALLLFAFAFAVAALVHVATQRIRRLGESHPDSVATAAAETNSGN